jgi:hypothetical protein
MFNQIRNYVFVTFAFLLIGEVSRAEVAILPVWTSTGSYMKIIDIATGTLKYSIDLGSMTATRDGVNAVITPDGARAILPVWTSTGSYMKIIDIATGTLKYSIDLGSMTATRDGVNAVIPHVSPKGDLDGDDDVDFMDFAEFASHWLEGI